MGLGVVLLFTRPWRMWKACLVLQAQGLPRPLVLLHSSHAGCGSGSLPAAARPDGGI